MVNVDVHFVVELENFSIASISEIASSAPFSGETKVSAKKRDSRQSSNVRV